MNSKKRKFIHVCSLLVWVMFLPVMLSRCAHMMSPTGGPRDTLPPVILSMTPDNYATNRPLTKHERIYIEFDEFVQLKDQQKEFFTSPQMKKKPLVSLRGRGVVIQLRDTLEPNTTYALNFGGAIRDNNEGNPLYSMRYVFSTGPTVDSMIVSGYTEDGYKADSVSKSFIWFFPDDSIEHEPKYDSTIFKYKPAVIARAETNGIFLAQNLKPIPYRVYAVEDKNDNQIYEAGVDRVGFADGVYNPAEMPDFSIWYDSIRQYVSAEPQIYIRMFMDRPFRRQTLFDSERPMQHKALLYFTARHPQIKQLRIDSIPEDRILIDPQTEGYDTVALWFNMPAERLADTLKGEITYLKHDTLNVLHEVTEPLKLSWRKIESKDEERERKKKEAARKKAEEAGEEWKDPNEVNPFKIEIPKSGEVNPEKHLTATFEYPLSVIDSAVIHLKKIDAKTSNEERVPLRFVRDTADVLRWTLRADWVPNTKYQLEIPQGALVNYAGQKNDSLLCEYTTSDPEKYALMKLHIEAKDATTRYIVQLLDGSNKVLQEKYGVKAGDYTLNYVPVGDVKLRVVEDKNGNQRWDSGDVVARRQPERALFYFNEEGKDTFAAKANWEIELTIDMDKMFAPVTMERLSRMLDEKEEQRLKAQREREAKEGKKNKHDHDRDRQDDLMRNNNFGSAGNMFNRR